MTLMLRALLCVVETERHEVMRVSQEAKKSSRKRHSSSEPLSFEEMKSLAPKALVERYSKLTSDEMNKKYSYQCKLLPGRCSETFQSYGNEKKSWKSMKLHLMSHLKEDSSKLNVSVSAKSPTVEEKLTCSDLLQQSPKKFQMEPSCSNDFPELLELRRPCSAKKMLEFKGALNFKPISRRKKYTPKPKSKLPDRSKSFLLSLEYPPYDNEVQNESSKATSSSYDSEDSRSSMSSVMEPLTNVESTISVSSSSRSASVKPSVCLLDHDYAATSGVNFLPASKDDFDNSSPRKKVSRQVQKQFIIPTPRLADFDALDSYVVSEIVEIDALGNTVKPKQREDASCLDINSYVLNKAKEENFRTGKPNFDMLPIYKAQDVTGSVLECVENKVNTKSNIACSSKCKSYPSTSKGENSENVKVRKELALKHIAQLNKKKKKPFQGPLQCQLCLDGRHFTAAASLVHHYQSHAGIKLFKCNVCNGNFTRQHSLNYHMMIHTNKSRFVCEYCQKNFRHPSHFKEHLRKHTGETPFECDFCNMMFKTRNTYKRHLRMQHKKILTPSGMEDVASEGPSVRKSKRGSQ